MMDKDTANYFETLREETEKKFGKELFKEVRNELYWTVKGLLDGNEITKKERKQLSEVMARGGFGKAYEYVVRTDTTDKIKDFVDSSIEQAIKDGVIPEPDLEEYKNFSDKMKNYEDNSSNGLRTEGEIIDAEFEEPSVG
jgi:hypothetical protein